MGHTCSSVLEEPAAMLKACAECGKEFPVQRFHAATYCGSACRSRAWAREHGLPWAQKKALAAKPHDAEIDALNLLLAKACSEKDTI
jgi:hypothetical protein